MLGQTVHNSDFHPVSWVWMHGWPHNWTELWSANCVGRWCALLILDLLSKCVCTTRHQQTSGQLVQELNVCTVLTGIQRILVITTPGCRTYKSRVLVSLDLHERVGLVVIQMCGAMEVFLYCFCNGKASLDSKIWFWVSESLRCYISRWKCITHKDLNAWTEKPLRTSTDMRMEHLRWNMIWRQVAICGTPQQASTNVPRMDTSNIPTPSALLENPTEKYNVRSRVVKLCYGDHLLRKCGTSEFWLAGNTAIDGIGNCSTWLKSSYLPQVSLYMRDNVYTKSFGSLLNKALVNSGHLSPETLSIPP